MTADFGRQCRHSVIIIFVFLSFLVVPAEARDTQDRLTIAFVPRSLNNTVFLRGFAEARRLAEELNVDIEWLAPFSSNTEEQVQILTGLVARGVDGIVVSADNVESIRTVLGQAAAAGIVVATFDADIPDSGRLFHVGWSNYRAGVRIGEELLRITDQREPIDTQNILIMTGVRTAYNLEQRIAGFQDALDTDPRFRIREIIENQDSFETAVRQLEEFLAAPTEIDIVFITGGWAFHVPSAAMPKFRIWSQGGGTVLGVGIFHSSLELQSEGMIQYLVGQDTGTMAALALEHMVAYLRHGITPPERLETAVTESRPADADRLLTILEPLLIR